MEEDDYQAWKTAFGGLCVLQKMAQSVPPQWRSIKVNWGESAIQRSRNAVVLKFQWVDRIRAHMVHARPNPI